MYNADNASTCSMVSGVWFEIYRSKNLFYYTDNLVIRLFWCMMASFLSSVQPDIYPGAGFVVDLNINELCASDAIRPVTKRIMVSR